MKDLLVNEIGGRLKSWLKVAPKWLRNFYVLSGLSFLIWMWLFDVNNLSARFDQLDEFDQLKEEKAYYEQELERLRQERQELRSSNAALEKFAREKYFLRKDGEEVYLFVTDDSTSVQ